MRAVPALVVGTCSTLAALDAFEASSEKVLDEIERSVRADHPDIDSARLRMHTLAAMRRAFSDAIATPGPVPARLQEAAVLGRLA